MMAKQIKALELHYPMVQFLMIHVTVITKTLPTEMKTTVVCKCPEKFCLFCIHAPELPKLIKFGIRNKHSCYTTVQYVHVGKCLILKIVHSMFGNFGSNWPDQKMAQLHV